MEILYILVPIVLFFLVLAVLILFWAINHGQYDDLNTEANRILFDERAQSEKSKGKDSHKKHNTATNSNIKAEAQTQGGKPND